MNIPVEAVTEFQEIYRKKFGVVLDVNEAGVRAEKFLRLLVMLTNGSQNENERLHHNPK